MNETSYDPNLRPSATVGEAVERLTETCKRRINELEQQRDAALATRRERDWTDAEAHADPAGYRAYLERLRGHMLLEQNEAIVQLTRQRDELAACVREVLDRFVDGRICSNPLGADPYERIRETTFLVSRIQTALLRCAVRERLTDRVAAEQRKQEGAA